MSENLFSEISLSDGKKSKKKKKKMKHSVAEIDHTSTIKIKNVEIEFDYEQMIFFRILWKRSQYDDFDEWLREYIIVEGVGMLLNAITGLRYPDEF
tara:strand:- start:55 stop:342 length:288 start_codon:yes stop_codon:yes gene_type:complete